MVMKSCIKLDATWKRCPIVFQGHLSNFKVTQDNKSPIVTRFKRFQTVTLVWIHRWLWNDAQGLKQHGRGALLIFKVIHQISRSHGTKSGRHRRDALLFFKVIHQISRSHGTKSGRNWPRLGVSGVWFHQWLRNGAQSLKQHGQGSPLFFKVICQISRSHGTKNRRIWPKWGVSGL